MLDRTHKFDREVGKGQRFIRIALLMLVALPIATANARDTAQSRDPASKPRLDDRGPLLLMVSLRKQKLRVFDAGGEVASSRVSSGMPGFDTPTGVFSVLEKKERHYSNIYAGAPMPFMQRLTWSGIALHSGVVPGYRASHGCIRLPHSFAQSLFKLTRAGVRVVVAQDEAQPIPFSHPVLFRPLPERDADPQVASASSETLLAVNTVGAASETMSEFRSILGVTPALAAAVADSSLKANPPRTRVEAERRASMKVSAANAAMKIALASRAGLADAAKSAVRDADAASARLNAARRSSEPARRALADAEADLLKAQQAFAAMMGQPLALASIDAEDRESDLEDAILDTTIAVGKARAGLARGELEFAAREAEAAAGNRARVNAVAAVRKNEDDLKKSQAQLDDLTKDLARRSKPLSVLISLRSSRIYLRQGFEAVVEAPITMSEPPRKIGTYVLTAMRYQPGDSDKFDWRLLTAQTPAFSSRQIDDRRNRKSSQRELPAAQGSATAVLSAALDGIEIPDEILQTITERVRPGASLIVTDRELKESENGLNTEFVLHTR